MLSFLVKAKIHVTQASSVESCTLFIWDNIWYIPDTYTFHLFIYRVIWSGTLLVSIIYIYKSSLDT